MRALVTFLYACRIALGSLISYRLRTFLTALGVLVGVTTVIAIDGIIQGMNRAFKGQVSMLGTGTLYVSQHPWIILNDWWKYRGRPDVTMGDAEFLAQRLSLADIVVPFVHHRTEVTIGSSELKGVRIIGSTHDWTRMSGLEPAIGRFFTPGEYEAGTPVCAIGADTSEVMKKEGLIVGDYLKMAGHKIRIVGVLPSRGSFLGQSQDDFVVMPVTLFRRLFGGQRSMNIGVVVDPDNLDRAEDEIYGAMRVRRKLPPGAPDNFSINRQQMFIDLYEKITRSLFATAVGLGFITLIVGGVGIMNIMLVAVAERTQEIGIRKALGARPATILAQFLIEAVLVSGMGGILGTSFGLLLAKLIDDVSPLPAAVSPGAIVFGVGFGLFVGVVFGFLPALRAARLTPVVALRAD